VSTLTPAQIAQVAASAGFKGNGLVAAVAVALAESGGRTDVVAVNDDPWRSRDRGLWQINDHWHPEVGDTGALLPASAASAAYRISKGGTDWSQWSTWKNGSAQAQMGRARLGVAQAGITTTTTTATAQSVGFTDIDPGDVLKGGLLGAVPGAGALNGLSGGDLVDNPLRSLNGLLAVAIHAGQWMSDSHNWARVAMVAGGTVGVLIGASMVARSGAAGSTVASVAPSNLIPIGRVANTVKAAAAAGK
jgi:hypothetical protein